MVQHSLSPATTAQMHADAAPQGNFMGRFIYTCSGMV